MNMTKSCIFQLLFLWTTCCLSQLAASKIRHLVGLPFSFEPRSWLPLLSCSAWSSNMLGHKCLIETCPSCSLLKFCLEKEYQVITCMVTIENIGWNFEKFSHLWDLSFYLILYKSSWFLPVVVTCEKSPNGQENTEKHVNINYWQALPPLLMASWIKSAAWLKYMAMLVWATSKRGSPL